MVNNPFNYFFYENAEIVRFGKIALVLVFNFGKLKKEIILSESEKYFKQYLKFLGLV